MDRFCATKIVISGFPFAGNEGLEMKILDLSVTLSMQKTKKEVGNEKQKQLKLQTKAKARD